MAPPLFCVCLFWITFCQCMGSIFGLSNSGSGQYVGCYKDEGNPRMFKGQVKNSNDLTTTKCTESCYSSGFLYSATQGRRFCFCDDKHPNPNTIVGDEYCFLPCAGNPAEKCGGDTSISVRKTGIPDHSENKNYIGCFDDHTRLLNDVTSNFYKTNTPRRCMNYCLQLGYQYSGVQYSRGCHCGNNDPEPQHRRSEDECNWPCSGDPHLSCGGNWRMAVYSTKIPESDSPTSIEVGKYIGCYSDKGNPRTINGLAENFNDLDLQKCTVFCHLKAFLYAWTQNSTFCFCGDKRPNPNSKISEDQCSSPCAGNHNDTCGGEASISVRETGVPDYPEIGKYLGCFDDHSRLLNDFSTNFDLTNSPRRCMNYCFQMGYQYSGVQYGRGCHCGNQDPDKAHIRSPEECNWPCAGDPLESCGGNWRMAIYATNFTIKQLPFQASPASKPCVRSETVVNNNNPCRGDILFEDTFDGPLSHKWKHVVMIADAPDYEFTVFHSDPQNSYTSDGTLVIKPSLFDDAQVYSGSLDLKGCTAPQGTRQCGYKAFSFNILPPVASARLNTRDSFSFRYGVVEIRAKMPVGDWLVPELWLDPKDSSYGPDYSSGRVRIAITRGNSDLRCDGQDLGLRELESGVLMGPRNNVRKRSVRINLPENWHDDFHNYTLIWKPDSISFKIDSEPVRELVPVGKRLCEAQDFAYEDCLTWSGGSKIAPLDKNFYISLGLSAGNAWDFPDECVSRGKPKPWHNLEVKAMLKFWQNKKDWISSWSVDKSALYIDHVRVTAL